MEKEIKKIVLTGGPCSGKSTALEKIKQKFEKEGYKVIFVPEEATELINNGMSPNEAPTIEFQTMLMKLQMEKEDLFENICRHMNYDKFLIVCDRGVFDNRAYMSHEEFKECLDNLGINREQAMQRYDACFYLETAANCNNPVYNNKNKARKDNKEEAQVLDDKTLEAWIGHPHFRIIKKEEDFDKKMEKLLKEIYITLGIPLPLEIERKFLIQKPNKELLERLEKCKKVRIIQTYLLSDDGYETRLRLRESGNSYSYTLTKKKKISDTRRIEVEKGITQNEYIELLMKQDPTKAQIVKDRYFLCYHNQTFEIDIYPTMEDHAICEIELQDEKQPIDFPTFLIIEDEVTDKEEYKNSSIASKLLKERKAV